MVAEWLEINVDASPMRALRVMPALDDADAGEFTAGSSGPDASRAGVVVCMHAPGIDAFMLDIAHRLGAAGYAAIIPDLYHRQDPDNGDGPLQRMARLDDAELFRDLAAATAALRMTSRVAARRIAVIGFCMGGRIAWLQAARDATLNAVCCFYPGNIDVAWSASSDANKHDRDANNGDGTDVSAVAALTPLPVALTPLQWGARIAVPVLGLFGADDANPGAEHRQAMTATLERTGVVHDMRVYPGCGHAFLNFQRPSFQPEAAADAWQRCLDWLATHNRPD